MGHREVVIRRIGPDDGPLLRDLRLRSLEDAPAAFGQRPDEARARPAAEWARDARRSASGDARAWLIAEDVTGAIGIVQGRRRRPDTLLLFSMWVAPPARRTGVGRMLVEALEAWARVAGATRTVLWVMAGNRSAIDFYGRLGFQTAHQGPDVEAGLQAGAIVMQRSIGVTTARPTR